MKIFSIYKATNVVNGKVYIGFDSNWPKRKRDHISQSSNNKAIDYNSIFHRAIRKYGWDAFEWEVICQSKDGKYLLNEMEGYFIREYDSFNDGYNMTLGGEGKLGHKSSDETKKKMSLWQKGIPKSKKHREKLKIARNKRSPHSEETKRKMSLSHKNKKSPHKNLPKSKETKRKMSISAKLAWAKRKQ